MKDNISGRRPDDYAETPDFSLGQPIEESSSLGEALHGGVGPSKSEKIKT